MADAQRFQPYQPSVLFGYFDHGLHCLTVPPMMGVLQRSSRSRRKVNLVSVASRQMGDRVRFDSAWVLPGFVGLASQAAPHPVA